MRLVVVDDHGLMGQSLAAALQLEGFDVSIIDASDPGADIMAQIRASAADLALMDLDLGSHGSALPMFPPLREAGFDIVVMTGVEDPVRHAECIEAGAMAVLRKAAPFDDLTKALQTALQGEPLMTDHERQEQLALLRRHRNAEQRRLAPFEQLTPREGEVLGQLMAGRTAAQIAEDAVVSLATIRSQIKSILTKLEVHSQVAAIGRAREAGWQPPSRR